MLSLDHPKEIKSTGDLTRLFFQCLSITCVDIFVMISGWFGINPSIKGFLKFIFQWLFFSIGIYTTMAFMGRIPFNANGILNCFMVNQGGYWFICSYSILYFLSPILNAGAKNIKRKEYKWILISFYTFIFIYSWCFLQVEFVHGYSAICFIGLYMLSRYLRIHQPSFANHSKNIYLFTFLSIVIISSIILGIAIHLHRGGIPTRMSMFYETPTTILAAMAIIIYFSKIEFKSRFVNWIASSCFAVYLFHTNYLILDEYTNIVRKLFDSHNGVIALLYIGSFIFVVFVISIIIDQPRKLIWNFIREQIDKKIKRH